MKYLGQRVHQDWEAKVGYSFCFNQFNMPKPNRHYWGVLITL
jgi:hypothetical protein